MKDWSAPASRGGGPEPELDTDPLESLRGFGVEHWFAKDRAACVEHVLLRAAA